MNGGWPARPQDAQELGLTDSVWDMTVRCWHQDPAQRPMMTEVVKLARELSVFSLSLWNEHHNMLPAVTSWMFCGLESQIYQSRSSPTISYPSVKSRMQFPSAVPTSSLPSSRMMKCSGKEIWRSITISQCRGRLERVAGSSSTRD